MEQVTLPLWVVGAVLAVLGFLLSFLMHAIVKSLKEVRVGVGEMNVNLKGLLVWKDGHEKQDDERHQELLRRLDLRQSVR